MGTIVYASERNTSATKINQAREQWGLSQSAGAVSIGNNITASDINNLLELLRGAKTTSGWDGVIPSNVEVGAYITNIFATLNSTADAIKSHCPCYGNCTGSCTGTCTGTCAGTCTGSCNTTCTGNCDGTCRTTCSGKCTATCSNNNDCSLCNSGCGGCGSGCGATGKATPFLSKYYKFKITDIRKYKGEDE